MGRNHWWKFVDVVFVWPRLTVIIIDMAHTRFIFSRIITFLNHMKIKSFVYRFKSALLIYGNVAAITVTRIIIDQLGTEKYSKWHDLEFTLRKWIEDLDLWWLFKTLIRDLLMVLNRRFKQFINWLECVDYGEVIMQESARQTHESLCIIP